MKTFFRSVLSSCLGTLIALSCIFILFMVIGSYVGSQTTTIDDKSILFLELNDIIPEKSGNVKEDPYELTVKENLGLREIKDLIKHAATDKKIEGILLKNTSVHFGQATLLSLIDALKSFKDSDKFIYSYSDFHSQSSYLLSSVADSMFMNPNGSIDIKGYGYMVPFYKDMMEKVGLSMNVFYAGNFKSATEPFRRSDMSEENRLQTKEFLEGMFGVFSEKISKNRNIDNESLDLLIRNYNGRSTEKAVESGLVDASWYWDQMETYLNEKVGNKPSAKLKLVKLGKYKEYAQIKSEGSFKDPKIAVIFAEGDIMYNSEEKGVISERKYGEIFRKIRKDDKVKAVVLRVNSGGGSSISSDIIHREIKRIQEAGKPVIASFGDYAASGGYYISASADTIVAAPNTLTGSIGVFTMFPNARKLANEVLDIQFDTVKTHPLAVGFNTFYDLSDQEKEIMQEFTDDVYKKFINVVAEGREMKVEEVKEIAQGRVWTGEKAVEIGLVDAIGDLEDAIEIAAETAGLEKYRIKEYPEITTDPWKEILTDFMGQASLGTTEISLDPSVKRMIENYKEVKTIFSTTEPQMRLPFKFIAN